MAERQSDHSACPFCGNSCSERRWVDYQYRVVCEHCGAMGPGTDMEAVAVPNWNRRARTLDATPSEPSAEHWRRAIAEVFSPEQSMHVEAVESRAREIAREGK